jgi:glyoxylate carboligase
LWQKTIKELIMTTETVAGAKLVVDALVARGVEKIFTLSGGHITPIYQYLEDTDVTLFDTRHEQAALFMAEAWGKMTRQPGVAMVTAGPGFTNALTGVASAYFSNTPLVVIAGCVGLDHKEKLDLQDMSQAPVIDPMVKRAFVCQKAGAGRRICRSGVSDRRQRSTGTGLSGISRRCAERPGYPGRHSQTRDRDRFPAGRFRECLKNDGMAGRSP